MAEVKQFRELRDSLFEWRDQVETDHTSLVDLGDLEYKHLTTVRSILDDWMSLRAKAAELRAQIRGAMFSAEEDYEVRRSEVVAATDDIALSQGMYASYEERTSYYNKKLFKEKKLLDTAKHLLDLYTEFIRDLDKMYTHWHNRKVDIKWELDKISQISVREYDN